MIYSINVNFAVNSFVLNLGLFIVSFSIVAWL